MPSTCHPGWSQTDSHTHLPLCGRLHSHPPLPGPFSGLLGFKSRTSQIREVSNTENHQNFKGPQIINSYFHSLNKHRLSIPLLCDYFQVPLSYFLLSLCSIFGIIESQVAHRLKRLPAMQETWVLSLGREDPLEKEMATHSSILTQRIPWMEEPGGLQPMGLQRVGHN